MEGFSARLVHLKKEAPKEMALNSEKRMNPLVEFIDQGKFRLGQRRFPYASSWVTRLVSLLFSF